MSFNVASVLQNVARLMAYSMPDRLALELVNQEMLYATNSVISATSAEPEFPSEGDAYIIPTDGWGSADLANFIAFFDGENFLTAPPRTSMFIFIQDTESFLTFNGTSWEAFSPVPLTVGAPISGGTVNGILYNNANALGNLATANSGVLVTSGSGVPSISTTLPNGLAMGTPASLNLSNATALPISTGVSGLASGIATFLATPTSANLLAALTTKTGTGNAVFSASPTLSGTIGGNLTWSGNQTISGSLTAAGALLLNTVTQTTTYSVGATDYTIRADATGGAFTITLPAVATANRTLIIKKIDASGNNVTVSGDGNIDGASSYILAFTNQSITLQSNGATWDVL